MYLASQIISLIGMAFGFAAFQCKKHSGIMVFKLSQEFLSSVHYVLLGGYIGAVMNLLGCVRNGVFAYLVAKNKKTRPAIIIFTALFIIFGIIAWQGPKSLLVILAKVLSCIAYGCKDTAIVRRISLLTNSFWFIYNIIVFSIAAFTCDGIMLLSVIIGTIRYDILPRFRKKEQI